MRQWRGESDGGKSTDAPRDRGCFRAPSRADAHARRALHPRLRGGGVPRERVHHHSRGSSSASGARRPPRTARARRDGERERRRRRARRPGRRPPFLLHVPQVLPAPGEGKELAEPRGRLASTRGSSRAVSEGTRTSWSSNAPASSSNAQTTRETFSTVGETLVPLDPRVPLDSLDPWKPRGRPSRTCSTTARAARTAS